MDKKINIADLAKNLSAKNQIGLRESEIFVREFFDTIEKNLLRDKLVKIKGLGTFKVVDVADRESVNVNTGARIRIQGHAKVSFTPDPYLRDRVNKPFANFETVILNEGTSIEEMERVPEQEDAGETSVDVTVKLPDQYYGKWSGEDSMSDWHEVIEIPEQESHKKEEVKPEPIPVSEPEPIAPDVIPKPEPIPEQIKEPDPVFLPEPDPEPVLEKESANIPDVEPAREIFTESVLEPEISQSEETFESENESLAETTQISEPLTEEKIPTASISEEEPKPVKEIENIDKIQPSENKKEKSGREVVNDPIASEPYREKEIIYKTVTIPAKNENSWVYYCIWFLVTLLLMSASYFAGYYKWLCPCGECEDSVERKVIPVKTVPQAKPINNVQNVKDSVSSKPVEPVVEETIVENNYPQVPGGQYLIVGTRKVHIMSRGDNLYKMALNEYGSKDFAKYIIVYNQFHNPDVIPLGYEVKLPELKDNK